jgi:hypothetical protein
VKAADDPAVHYAWLAYEAACAAYGIEDARSWVAFNALRTVLKTTEAPFYRPVTTP